MRFKFVLAFGVWFFCLVDSMTAQTFTAFARVSSSENLGYEGIGYGGGIRFEMPTSDRFALMAEAFATTAEKRDAGNGSGFGAEVYGIFGIKKEFFIGPAAAVIRQETAEYDKTGFHPGVALGTLRWQLRFYAPDNTENRTALGFLRFPLNFGHATLVPDVGAVSYVSSGKRELGWRATVSAGYRF